MAEAAYTVIYPEMTKTHAYEVHAEGCKDITRNLRRLGGHVHTETLDLESGKATMAVLDPDQLGYEISDVKVYACTRPVRTAAEQAQANAGARAVRATTRRTVPRRRNGKAADAAVASAEEIVKDEVAKVIANRDQPTRLATCDDETYAKALRVRELRSSGTPWWRIAHEMGLPGSGPSVKQGKTGAAHVRRLWERAWGKTYSDTTVPRDTKERKKERALTQDARPFFPSDTPDLEIIDAITGKKITWYTRLETNGTALVVSEQESLVFPKNVQIVQGPKGRVVSFWEMPEEGSRVSGPRRSVYVDRIEKVGL